MHVRQEGRASGYLELCYILEHHVDVLVEPAQRAHKFLVALQNDPDLRPCQPPTPRRPVMDLSTGARMRPASGGPCRFRFPALAKAPAK